MPEPRAITEIAEKETEMFLAEQAKAVRGLLNQLGGIKHADPRSD